MSLRDMCRLQGFTLDELNHVEAGVSDKLVAAAIGNMMSVNVVREVMLHALYHAKLIDKTTLLRARSGSL